MVSARCAVGCGKVKRHIPQIVRWVLYVDAKGTGKSVCFYTPVSPIRHHAIPRSSKLDVPAEHMKLGVPWVLDV